MANLAELIKETSATKSITIFSVVGTMKAAIKSAEAADTIVVAAGLELIKNPQARFCLNCSKEYAIRVATSASREYGELAKVYKKQLSKEQYFSACSVILDSKRTEWYDSESAKEQVVEPASDKPRRTANK